MDLSPTSTVFAKMDPNLRIVLLGRTGVGKSAAAKTILGNKGHPWVSSATLCCEKKTNVYGLNLTVIDTPGLFGPTKSNGDIMMAIAKCISTVDPSPLVFLIVLQPTRFTPEDEKTVEIIKKTFGKQAARYAMVLFTHGDELRDANINIEDMLEIHKPLKRFISQCSALKKFEDKYHVFDNEVEDPAQVNKLLEKMQRMVQRNGGSFYTYEMYIESLRAKQEEMKRQVRGNPGFNPEVAKRDAPQAKMDPDLRIVLLGRTGVGKSAAGNTILGGRRFSLSSETLVCQRESNNLYGFNLDVVDTPDLFGSILEYLICPEHMAKCISMAASSPHVFLIVLHPTRFTPEDEKTVEIIRKTFGKQAVRYAMVLFTHGDELRDANINMDDILYLHKPLKRFISQCSALKKFEDKYHVFDNEVEDPAQVNELLEKIQRMVQRNGGSFYTYEMYIESLRANQEEMERQVRENPGFNPEVAKRDAPQAKMDPDLRIVLLGRTGVGKSAAGNTILGGRWFQSRFSLSSETLVCQRESNNLSRFKLDVVDTPDLFGSNLEYLVCPKQIARCISMAAPGPHVFLIVLQPTRFTPEESKTVKIIQRLFGEAAARYTMVLFTYGDVLKEENMTMENMLEKHQPLKRFISQCSILEKFEDKYHVFDNETTDRTQVSKLLDKINKMVEQNGGSYSNEMFREAQKAKQEEMEQLHRESPNTSFEDRRKQAERENSFIRAAMAAAGGAAAGAAAAGGAAASGAAAGGAAASGAAAGGAAASGAAAGGAAAGGAAAGGAAAGASAAGGAANLSNMLEIVVGLLLE